MFRRVFAPILNIFENDSDEYVLSPKNRWICNAISGLFVALALVIFFIGQGRESMDYLFPFAVFLIVGSVGLVVGLLGSDHAVAKLLGARK